MMRHYIELSLLIACLAGCRYTEDDYVNDWIDLHCVEMIDVCGGDFGCEVGTVSCCRQVIEEEAGDESLVDYYLGECPAFDGEQAKACLEAWRKIVDSNECLDGAGGQDISSPPECENVCIPSVG